MSQPQSYTSGRSFGDTIREFRELRHSYRAATSRIPADAAKAIEDCRLGERAFHEATGSELKGKDCLELGAGQVLGRATYFSQHNRVTASDMEEYVHGFDIPGYWSMLRTNGPKRVIKALGRKALGMDRRGMKEMLKQMGPPKPAQPAFVRCDATKMPFADGSFDFIYSYNVFEHIPDPAAVWRECRRVLRPGGCLFTHLHLFTSDSGGHDLRIIRGEHEGVPYWPHLRPKHQSGVINAAYLNKITLTEWRRLIDAELPGATTSYIRDDELTPELTRVRTGGELAEFTDDDLIIRNIVTNWRKPRA